MGILVFCVLVGMAVFAGMVEDVLKSSPYPSGKRLVVWLVTVLGAAAVLAFILVRAWS